MKYHEGPMPVEIVRAKFHNVKSPALFSCMLFIVFLFTCCQIHLFWFYDCYNANKFSISFYSAISNLALACIQVNQVLEQYLK